MIYRVLPFVIGLGALWGSVSSLLALRAAVISNSALASARDARLESPRGSDGRLLTWTKQAEDALVATEAAALLTSEIADIESAVYWIREKSRLTDSADHRIELLCRGLGLYGAGLVNHPRSSNLLLGWSSLRQLLSSTDCPQGLTKGEMSQVVETALKWNPYDHDIVFGSALLQLWSGRREQALTLFQRLLSYSTNLTRGEEGVIADELREASDVRQIVPARFPQAVYWSRVLRERRPGDFDAWRAELSDLQGRALADARVRVAAGSLPLELYDRDLRSLLRVAAKDSIRQEIDRELSISSKARGEVNVSKFFTLRASLQKLEVISSSISGDTRTISPFVRWGGNDVVYFDDFSESVGFFLPENQGVSLIVLRSVLGRSSTEVGMLRLFASDDNERWIEIVPLSIEAFTLEGESLVGIAVPPEGHKYWKIHNGSVKRERSFAAPLEDFITVYGRSSRRDEL